MRLRRAEYKSQGAGILHRILDADAAKLQVLEDAGSEYGFLEGYASTFGNVDQGNEIVVKGAFSKTLRERLKKGNIKLCDSHRMGLGTAAIIGLVEDAKEDETGLWFRARFSSVTLAQEIRTKIKEGILGALSIGYNVIKDVADPKTGVRKLLELRLFEISVVPFGMNELATITAIKDGIDLPEEGEEPPQDTGTPKPPEDEAAKAQAEMESAARLLLVKATLDMHTCTLTIRHTLSGR